MKECPACGKKGDFEVIDYLDTEFNDKSTSIFNSSKINICSKCGFGFTDRFYPLDVLEKFYTNDYRSEKSPFCLTYFSKFQINSRALSQALLIKQFAVRNNSLKYLDIGAGTPHSANAFYQSFPRSEIFIVEPSKQSHDLFKKIGYKTFHLFFSPTSAKLLPTGYFDVINLSHILEHFNGQDIDSLLDSIYSLLRENGLLLIEVPISELPKYKDIRYNDSPHLSFFSKASMLEFANKSKFKVLFINNCGITY